MYLLGLLVALVCFIFYASQIFAKNNFNTDRLQRFAFVSAYLVAFPVLIVGDMFGGIFLEYEYYAVFLWPFLALVIFTFEFELKSFIENPDIHAFFCGLPCCATSQTALARWVIRRRHNIYVYL